MASSSTTLLKTMAFAWFKFLYAFVRQERASADSAGSPGCGSEGRKGSVVTRGEYRVTCESAGDFKGVSQELPTSAISRRLERETGHLLEKIGVNGLGYLDYTYAVGFSDRVWCAFGGRWQELAVMGGMCEALASRWSNSKADFESMRRSWKTPVCDDKLFTVTIRIFLRDTIVSSVLSCSYERPKQQQQRLLLADSTITGKTSSTPQSLCKLSWMKSSGMEGFVLNEKKFIVGLNISKGVIVIGKYESSDTSTPCYKRKILPPHDVVKVTRPKKETGKNGLLKRCLVTEVSGSALTPPLTPNSEESLSPSTSPLSSPIIEHWTDPSAKRMKTNESIQNGLSQVQSPVKANSIFPSPPESPSRGSLSPSPPSSLKVDAFDVQSIKNFYSSEQTLLATNDQFLSAVTHYNSLLFQKSEEISPTGNESKPCPSTIGNKFCPYSNNLLKMADSVHGITDKPYGKSKLFSTWSNLTPDDSQSSSVLCNEDGPVVDDNEKRYLELVEDLLAD